MKNKAYHNRVFYYREQVIGWLSLRFPEIEWAEVASGLPEVVWRNRWSYFAEIYGLPYSRKYLQNLDSAGRGPAAFQVGERGK